MIIQLEKLWGKFQEFPGSSGETNPLNSERIPTNPSRKIQDPGGISGIILPLPHLRRPEFPGIGFLLGIPEFPNHFPGKIRTSETPTLLPDLPEVRNSQNSSKIPRISQDFPKFFGNSQNSSGIPSIPWEFPAFLRNSQNASGIPRIP